ncbi:hypothetical protein [Polymorphospora lycopeni]|uniref:DUF3558 domain-containing protein n=1 Tax=Polymorphospora lycopeni TaxID=3140240 RepID=A0ABV5CV41_9ACTN
MRARTGMIGMGLFLLAGCGSDAAAVPPPPAPPPVVTALPASVAGGACVLLDYAVIEETTGTRFTVAAAMEHQKTRTCVVQDEGASRPDLVLSLTATGADQGVFTSEMVPKGATTVKELGKGAYRSTTAPAGDDGAAAEVGWLTGEGRLVTLRYTFPVGPERSAADELAPKLVELARQVAPRVADFPK